MDASNAMKSFSFKQGLSQLEFVVLGHYLARKKPIAILSKIQPHRINTSGERLWQKQRLLAGLHVSLTHGRFNEFWADCQFHFSYAAFMIACLR
jgi:hypothetical protein